jgi:hypothetical protein
VVKSGQIVVLFVVNLDFGAKQHHDDTTDTTDTTIHQSARAQFERDRKAIAFKEKCRMRAFWMLEPDAIL